MYGLDARDCPRSSDRTRVRSSCDHSVTKPRSLPLGADAARGGIVTGPGGLLVGPVGIEPTTFGLKARCSAN